MQIFRGFLLSYIRYSDYDAVLHCFTEDHGFKSLFVKGIYNPKSKKKSYLFPLNELEISVNTFKEDKISTVVRLELLQSFYDDKNLNHNSVLMFSSDFLSKILRNENVNKEIYNEIHLFLEKLSHNNPFSHISLVFNLLRYNGLLPLETPGHFLDPETGRFNSIQTHQFFDEKISEIWKKFGSKKDNYNFTLSRSERNRFLQSLMLYYKIHFTDFREPDSLEILRQVFS